MSNNYINSGLRFTQFIFGLIAMSCITTSFKVINGYQLGSPEYTFLFLLSFSIWFYSLIYLFRIHFLQKEIPNKILLISIDTIITICLFSGGIAGVSANIYQDCDKLSNVKCSSLISGLVFTFLNLIVFIWTIGYNILYYTRTNTIDMNTVTTPVGNPF